MTWIFIKNLIKKFNVSGPYNRIIAFNIFLIVLLIFLCVYLTIFNRLDSLFGSDMGLSERLKFFGWIMGGCIAIIGIAYSGKRTKHFENNLHETQLTNILKLLSDSNKTAQVMGFSALIDLGLDQSNLIEQEKIFKYIHNYIYMETLEDELSKLEKISIKNEQCLDYLLLKKEDLTQGKNVKKRNKFIDLSRCYLNGACLNNYHLEGVDFRDADLVGVQWFGSNLNGSKFSHRENELNYITEILSHLSDTQLTQIHIYSQENYNIDALSEYIKSRHMQLKKITNNHEEYFIIKKINAKL